MTVHHNVELLNPYNGSRTHLLVCRWNGLKHQLQQMFRAASHNRNATRADNGDARAHTHAHKRQNGVQNVAPSGVRSGTRKWGVEGGEQQPQRSRHNVNKCATRRHRHMQLVAPSSKVTRHRSAVTRCALHTALHTHCHVRTDTKKGGGYRLQEPAAPHGNRPHAAAQRMENTQRRCIPDNGKTTKPIHPPHTQNTSHTPQEKEKKKTRTSVRGEMGAPVAHVPRAARRRGNRL